MSLRGGRAAPLVVIGAGHAGGRAAAHLRNAGYGEPIVVLGEEADPPYERPPLSKDVLSADRDPLCGRLYPDDFYRHQSIELRLGNTVRSVDTRTHRVHVGSEAIDYGTLIIATGSRARMIAEANAALPGVHSLRTAADARRLRAELVAGRRLLIIGGGFIGLEVAACARLRGCEVTLWESQPRLVQRSFDPLAARLLARRHTLRGVAIRCGVSLQALRREGTELLATTHDATTVAADVVVVGVGGVANDELAREAGILCEGGIVIDDHCRTSAADVYAIGDVANQFSEFYRRRQRLESWENAEHQAQAVTDAILGAVPKKIDVPWFWTDQYDDNWQMLGSTAGAENCVMRGDPEGDRWITLAMMNGRVAGAVMLNMPRARRSIKKLIDSRAPVDESRLADVAIPLESLN